MNTDEAGPGLPAAPEGSGTEAALAAVGSASRLADGTIRLELRTETPDGTIGEALMVVAPDDVRHPGILAHLGGLEPGKSCPIPPFPLPVDDDED